MYLDESILLLLAGRSELKKRIIAHLTLLLRAQGELFTSSWALWRTARYFKSHGDIPGYREYRREIASLFTEIFEVREVDQLQALEIHEQYGIELSAALHCALMSDRDVNQVLSMDKSLDRMKFLNRIAPDNLVD